nr:cornifelin homolog B-like [Lytechinus pictus]
MSTVAMSFEWQPIVTAQPRGSIERVDTSLTSIDQQSNDIPLYPWLYPNGKRRLWSTGLFSCSKDVNTCLMGTFVPCHMCFIASSLGESLLAGACVPFSNLVLRTLLRGRHNIEGSVMNDCLVTTLCPCFAQCQLAREIRMIQDGDALP